METDPEILSFQHCDKNISFLCFQLPRYCSLCKADLYVSDLLIPPFKIPSPFTDASKASCSFVLRPTNGDYLNNYKNNDDLHIGITDSQGLVYEYDQDGLKFNESAKWRHCLKVDILNDGNEKNPENWDRKLHSIFQDEKWTANMYQENKNNCFSFILEFLQTLNLKFDKIDFCQLYILPQTLKAAKYISLYRKLVKKKVLIKSKSH